MLTYQDLDHVDSVFSHLADEVVHVHGFLDLRLIQHGVQSYEGACPADPGAVRFRERLE